MRLTAATISTLVLPPGKVEHIFFDAETPGFGVRLRAGGSKRYVLQYALAGRTKRIVIGAVGVIDHGRARATAKDLIAKVRLGADPAAERAVGRAAAAETFEHFLPGFLERQRARLRPRSLIESERHLLRHARPLHSRPLAKIDRREIATLLAGITTTSGPTAAKHVRQTLSAYYRWAAGEGVVENNPVEHTNIPVTKPSRTRVLSESELRIIWLALGDDRYSLILKLLLLTGLRRSEIADLRWTEVDLGAATITISPARAKNKREHVVPLSEPALALLAEQRRERTGDMVLGGVDERGFQNWHGAKRELDARIESMSGTVIPGWTAHDFRRTLSTALYERGWSPLVVEEILGHNVGTAVSRIYNRSSHLSERRRALEWWAQYVSAIVEGRVPADNVVPLHA